MAKTMIVIGVTGGIASGKSLVAQQLGRLGAAVLEADQIGHAVLREPAVRAALCTRWGAGILDAAGEIRRSAVAERVFAPPPDGPRELAFLEQRTHPRIAAHLSDRLHTLARQCDVRVVVLDAAVLYKAGWDAYCDIIIFVAADSALRAARARQRGWSDEQWHAREAAQPAVDAQRARAHVVLRNVGTREQLMAQVEKFWQSLQVDSGETNFRERPFPNTPEQS
jgi:dephospho-CoA kinase